MFILYLYSLIVYNYDLYSSFITKVGTLQAFQCKIVTPHFQKTRILQTVSNNSYWYFHRNNFSISTLSVRGADQAPRRGSSAHSLTSLGTVETSSTVSIVSIVRTVVALMCLKFDFSKTLATLVSVALKSRGFWVVAMVSGYIHGGGGGHTCSRKFRHGAGPWVICVGEMRRVTVLLGN